ncbi:MAG: regulatory protein RecX [Gammaproteobacteria bacterium]
MDFLARREHGAQELLNKLMRKGFTEDCAMEAVARLTDEGLQCDERYAESVVSARINQGKGPLHILHGLKKSGIASSVVESALAAADIDWLEHAVAVREKRFGDEPAAEPSEHARQMRFLLQRGFSPETAHRAIDN